LLHLLITAVEHCNTDTPLEKSVRYHTAATSDNTRKAYIVNILNARTLSRRLVALKQWHLFHHFSDLTDTPIVDKSIMGILRIHGRPKKRARPENTAGQVLKKMNDQHQGYS
jgi:hypothetical protein